MLYGKIIAAGALALVIASAGYLYSQDFRPVVFAVAERAVADIAGLDEVDPGDFTLLFCGTGSPNRSPDRGQPCTALVAAGKLFLFDAGEGTIGKLAEYGAPTGRLDTIFLTHLHSDHVSGVAEVLHNTWLYGRENAVDVVGPPGTRELITGFALAYRHDLDERMRVLGPEGQDASIAFTEAREVTIEGPEAQNVYQKDGLTIQAFRVDHPDWRHAYGYRIEYQGKTIVISGDTRASEGIARHARHADVLIHEAVNLEIFNQVGTFMERLGGPIDPDRLERVSSAHTPTLELAQLAADAGVDKLVITHLVPAIPSNWVADRFFAAGMDEIYEGDIIVAKDGQWLEVR